MRCNCCSRTLVDYKTSRRDLVYTKYAISDVNGVICQECAKELDENGLFPEEQSLTYCNK